MKRKLTFGILGLALCCMVVAPVMKKVNAETGEGTIYTGIYIDGVDVSGLTVDEAYEVYEEHVEELREYDLVLTTANGEYKIPLSEIGLSVSLDDAVEEAYNYGRKGNILKRYKEINTIKNENVVLTPEKVLDPELLVAAVDEKESDIVVQPKNAELSRRDGKFYCEPGIVGIGLKKDETIEAINKAVNEEWIGEDLIVEAVVEETQPKYTEADFQSVTDVLGTCNTPYNGPAGRDANLANGASKINGTVLLPGEQFNMYETVSPFTEANGYKEAGQYSDGELVPGLGGGICQVSTTLYNAALKAEMEINERYCHSLSVSYVDKSFDAAIASTYKNFRFTNNTEYPVYIEGYASGGIIKFTIYGHETRPSNRTIKFVSKILSTIEPPADVETIDPTMPVGYRKKDQSAHTGYVAEMWKEIYIDGVLKESIKINSSTYNATPNKYTIGPPEPETPVVPETPVTPPETPITEEPATTDTATEQTGA